VVNNEEEGYGRNAGEKRHYYRIAISLAELWPGYAGSRKDGLLESSAGFHASIIDRLFA
jgi:hypothetical protein